MIFADAILIENGKRISLEDFQIFVVLRELRVVVARQTHSGLGEIVRSETEEFGFAGDFISGKRSTRDLDHRPDVIFQIFHPGRAQRLRQPP